MKLSAAGLLSIFIPVLSFATTVMHLDTAELSQKADAVVRVKILDVKAKEAPGEIKTIYTEIQARVLEIYKEGSRISKEDVITLRRLGGKLEQRTFVIPGTEQYAAGQESVLFLEKTPQDYFIILGMAQGKFDVVLDEKNQEKRVVRDLSDMSLVKKQGNAWGALTHSSHDAQDESKLSLSELEKIIKRNQ